MVLGLYVDDIVFGSTDEEEVQNAIRQIQTKYKSTYFGIARHLLGMRILQEDSCTHLSQEAFIDSMAEKFSKELPVSLPLTSPMSKSFDPSAPSKEFLHKEISKPDWRIALVVTDDSSRSRILRWSAC
jgi:hypothetical protein